MASANKVSSMTAFAQQSLKQDQTMITAELRAVNHRYLDLNVRLPEALRAIEGDVRDTLRGALKRGKVELNMRFDSSDTAQALELNQPLLDNLIEACDQISKSLKTHANVNVTELLRWPGAVITSQANQARMQQQALTLTQQLLSTFQDDRLREGAAMAKTIETRLASIREHVSAIKPHADNILSTQKAKLTERIEQANIPFDDHRLEQELVLWAQKNDIAEELDRLDTHLDEIQETLTQGGTIGRRLDFLVQECHREANTLSSKSMSSDITHHAVEIKVLIEQIREQVQNIE